ncbi:MAG: diguanylate cyclase domain-containing protein [Halarcobacter ebronensis]
MSIGASMFPEDNKDIEEGIKYSDFALYEAKESGRDKVVGFTA